MTTSTPPPSSLMRAVELDNVRDVMLLEAAEHMRAEPIPRHPGAPAPLGRLEARLRTSRATEDFDAERTLSLELSRVHFEHHLDIDMAVQLLHRALEIEDDRALRRELARRLSSMGRHVEAGHVLRDGEPQTKEEMFDSWIASGEAYARGGDCEEAVATFREAAMITPESPIPFARIAEVAYWAPQIVPQERAADAWLEAAKRQQLGTREHALAIICAFEVAPTYARSTEAYTTLLWRTGRSREADEIWRAYGIRSGHAASVAVRRAKLALKVEDVAMAFAATLEGHVAAVSAGVTPKASLEALFGDDRVTEWLAQVGGSEESGAEIIAAASARSSLARADGLGAIARKLTGEGRAILWSVASDAFASGGDAEQAITAAIEATRAAPWMPHAQSTLMALGADERVGLGDVERAMGRLPSRSPLLKLAAARFDATPFALVYDRQLAAIRPCDLVPLETLLQRGVGTADADAMAGAIGEVLSTARPWHDLADALAAALAALAATSTEHAIALVRRTLAVIGPGTGKLFTTMREIARQAGDPSTEMAMVLGRAVSDTVEDAERAAVYLEAAQISVANEDPQAAAVHTSRAAAHSGELERIMDGIEQIHALIGNLDPSVQSDANIALARANAWAAEQRDTQQAVEAWRYLGALRWDLADDRIGADEAFFVACAIDPETGPYRYAIDLRDRAGAGDAFPLVVERAVTVEHEGADARLYAKLYAAAARIASDAGMVELAIDSAVAAVRADPGRGDAVAIVEKLADGEQGLAALNFVYDTLADAALGRYGFRAAHYRAARQLEKLRAYDEALRHAILAFEAVPSVGASFRMLLRLAERTGNEEAALSTLVSVAATFPLERQLAWLVRVAERADDSRAGRELRLELLLKALTLRPGADLVDMLANAARAKLEDDTEATREVTVDRLERAARTALEKLNGRQAASAAVALSAFAASVIGHARLGIEALLFGLELNPYQLDVSPVVDHGELFANETDLAHRLLRQVNELRGDPSRPLDASVKDLCSKLYLQLTDVTPPPPTPVPPDGDETTDALGGFADTSLEEEALEEEAPDSGDLVTERPPEGFDEHARVDARHAPLPEVPDADERLLDAQLDSLEAGTDSDAQLFDAHFDAIESTDDRPSSPDKLVRIVGTEASEDSIPTRRPPADVAQPDPDAWRSQASPPKDAPDSAAEPPSSNVLELDDDDFVTITDRPPDDDAMDAFDAGAEATAATISDPGVSRPSPARDHEERDIDFSPESEAQARERGDHGAIAEMLAARIAATDNPEQRRLIRLRRAAVLEQRLNRMDDACAELEAILEESGDDPTALRYLADLRDRQERHARAAKLWLRASQGALHLDEKIRDVARCCESLVKAGRPETAKKLIDAARGLPQSPRLLKLRVTVARRLDDAQELAAAEAELAALGTSRSKGSIPPPEPLTALDATPPKRRSSTIPPRPQSQPPEALARGEREGGRNVFRVTNAPPSEELGEASEILEGVRQRFTTNRPETAREAKSLIRKLRSIQDEVLGEERDLHTYLLVECFDAAQGEGAAAHALQQHWESDGGTPLVTAAVADRLVLRGEVRPALLLYQRVMGRELRGVRDEGELALHAAELAHGEEDHERAAFFLSRALASESVQERAEEALAAWYPGGLPTFSSELESDEEVDGVEALAPQQSPLGPSKRKTDAPPPRPRPLSEPPADDASPDRASAPPAEERLSLEQISLSDEGSAIIESLPASVVAPSGPPSLRYESDSERDLFEALRQGRFEAGEELAALYEKEGDRRLLDLVTVRRLQATARRGDREVLAKLKEAAAAANADAYERAVDHVLHALDADHAPPEPPPLNHLAAQPEATTKLLFHHLDGTINEALAIVCESGMMRRELSDYDFTGTDRVPPVATTPVGRCYATLTRLIDLGNTRLFHRSRTRGRLEGGVALLSPLAAVLTGNAERETPTLRYVLGSALAAASPPLALIEGLDEDDARNLIQALHAGFGPVDDTSIQETSQAQMRIAEDLWHMVGSSADHRLRELCSSRLDMTYEQGKENAQRIRRRAGLFASGDLVTSIMQVVHESAIPMPRPIRGTEALAKLCHHPDISDLYDLALLPEYADARWQLA